MEGLPPCYVHAARKPLSKIEDENQLFTERCPYDASLCCFWDIRFNTRRTYAALDYIVDEETY